MRDISFLEWFLLGMPVEWFLLTVAAGLVLLVWTVLSTGLERWRRTRRGRRGDGDR